MMVENEEGQRVGARRRLWMWVLAIVVAAATVLVAAVLVWWWQGVHMPEPVALAALESGNGVEVREVDAGWLFVPSSESTTQPAGVVIYTGAHVDARAYAAFARALAERGHVVGIANAPLWLAFFNINAADALFDEPEFASVDTRILVGHSLGGVAAARYAASNTDSISGLMLLAAYPDRDTDLRGSGIPITSITATNDTVMSWEHWRKRRAVLPEDTTYLSIKGGNHVQFGDYGTQADDSPASISAEEQRAQVVDATVELVSEVNGAR